MGFKHYDVVLPRVIPDLTTAQKKKAIDEFGKDKSARNVKQKYSVKRSLVDAIFLGIKSIERYAEQCMQNTEAPIEDASELLVLVEEQYPDQIDIVAYLLTKMVKYSKVSGKGTWAFYKSQFGDE